MTKKFSQNIKLETKVNLIGLLILLILLISDLELLKNIFIIE